MIVLVEIAHALRTDAKTAELVLRAVSVAEKRSQGQPPLTAERVIDQAFELVADVLEEPREGIVLVRGSVRLEPSRMHRAEDVAAVVLLRRGGVMAPSLVYEVPTRKFLVVSPSEWVMKNANRYGVSPEALARLG